MTTTSPWRAVGALFLVLAAMISATGCGFANQSTSNSSTGPTANHAATPNLGPTPTTDLRSPLATELARLQAAFAGGQSHVTLDSATFPPGSQIVLLTHGTPGGGIVATYRYRTSAHGSLRTVSVAQDFLLVDWKYRFNQPDPVFVTDGANMVPLMAAVYTDFNNQRMSLAQAEQQINSGRPVGIERLTAQLIFIQDAIVGQNPDGTPKTLPINQISFMFSSADFTPEAINLG